MKKLILNFLPILILATALNGQEEANPIEKALAGVVTVAIFEMGGEDVAFGFGEEKTESTIAYEKALDMTGSVSAGSGFVIDYNGTPYIVTNAHVIDGAKMQPGSIGVYSIDRKKHAVSVVGGDSFYDIAVLAFEEEVDDIETLQFADKPAKLTEAVFSIGNPLGKYPYSITDGIVSGKNRLFQKTTTGKYGFLQHTATLIWGNSGGPLVNKDGEVVGVNAWIGTSNKQSQQYIFSQLNFAIEGALAERLVKEIIENDGRVKRSYLGIEFAVQKDFYGLEKTPFIKNVLPNSPAYEILKDKIGYGVKSINKQSTRTLQDVLRVLEESNPEEDIEMLLNEKGPVSLLDAPKISFTGNHTVQIKSELLSLEKLEDIAKHFFESYTDYQLNTERNEIGITGKPGKTRTKIERMTESGLNATFTLAAGQPSYGLVGSGVLDNWGRGTLYRVTSAKDIGAIIRLCSLEGHLSASVTSENDGVENVRFFLEDEDFNEIKVLYY